MTRPSRGFCADTLSASSCRAARSLAENRSISPMRSTSNATLSTRAQYGPVGLPAHNEALSARLVRLGLSFGPGPSDCKANPCHAHRNGGQCEEAHVLLPGPPLFHGYDAEPHHCDNPN